MPKLVTDSAIDVYPFCESSGRAQYLTLLRTPGLPLGNTWEVVHGSIEKRETAVQAAARELVTRTGIEPISLWNIDYINTVYVPDEDHMLLIPSIGALIPAEAAVQLTTEHVNWEWVSPENAMRRFLWVGQRLALQTLHDEVAGPYAAGQEPNPFLQIAPALYAQRRRGGR